MNRLISLNGTPPSPSLRQLREQAAQLGVPNVQKLRSRYRLIEAIYAHKAQVEQLRAECIHRGLPADGDEQTLRLRLAATRPGAVGRGHRRLWRAMGVAAVGLAVLALAVSLPHLAVGLARITGLGLAYAALLALVIDLGFAALKMIDTLAEWFRLSWSVRSTVWVLMVLCLGFSAAVNATEFSRTSEGIVLAWVTACFLGMFIFSMAMIGAGMLTRCEVRMASENEPSDVFRDAAGQYDRLERLAKKFGERRKA
ncbi:hypothetical protein AYO40_02540 [Planctomycetaceae bacterium SCGC AG-212-D15]|nr:hypothetical protein AYO40_02540 [Planctomycetaceae bacterium SCGC AG-212-D15]